MELWIRSQDKEQVFEIKKYREKRNSDQNSKYYKLLNELALKLKIGVEELHFKMLKQYSARYQILVPSGEQLRGIEYYEKKSKIINNEKTISDSGDYSQVATSGYSSQVAIDGEYSVGMCAGMGSTIKGKKGNWITLAEWEFNKDIKEYVPVCVKSAQIDGKFLKEDTYYKLENGDFVEC